MSPVFDLSTFFASFQVAGIPLTLVVLGVVQWLKKASPNGTVTRMISAIVGLVIGLGYWIATNGTPANFAGWFTAIIFGLALGLLASGSYDAGADVIATGQVRSVAKLEQISGG
jgi:hypothetical protein